MQSSSLIATNELKSNLVISTGKLYYGSIAVGSLGTARKGLRLDSGELITDEADVIFWRKRPTRERGEDIEI